MKHLIFLLCIISIASPASHCDAQSTALDAGNTIAKKLLKGETHIYTLAMSKGEYAECVVMQKGVDLAIDLIAPSGKKIQTFDSPNGFSGPEPVIIEGGETGNYQLHIYPMIEGQTGVDSASKEKFASENQGEYAINNITKLSATSYTQKLATIEADKVAFAQWVSSNAHEIKTVDAGNGYEDLRPFKNILKDVTVVGLGEASHGTSEFFRMKHRMLEYLVNEMSFNSFYIEASMARCRYINDYVVYGKGNLDTATVVQGFVTWRVDEVRDMIAWIRNHNKNLTNDKKVKFMGYDLQGNDYGWKDLQQFYAMVNPSMLPHLDSLNSQSNLAARLSNSSAEGKQEGAKLFKEVYQQCLNMLDDMVMNNGQYEYATSKELYDRNVMNIKLIIQEIESYKDGYNDRRDYYMAQNIMWLINQEKPGAKVVVWAHNGHIEKKYGDGAGTMGYYLSRYLQNKYYAVGFEFYKGSFQSRNMDINNKTKNWDIITIGEPTKESLPWYFNKTGKTKFYIDFKNSGANKVNQVSKFIDMHSFGSMYSPKYGRSLFPDKIGNFDGMIYIKESTAAKNFTKVSLY